MGIQGLLPLLKDIQTPVHISSYAGKTLGIDAYVWLHRGAYGCAREIVLGDPSPRYISYTLSRIRMLQHFGVKPYLVFDGDKLPAKQGTEEDRELKRYENLQRAKSLEKEGKPQEARELYSKCVDITPEMAFQLIKVLKQDGIPYVVAPYEADAQLAFLESRGIIDGIVTEDSDLLVFGCKTVLFKLDQAGNCIEILQNRFWTNRQIALSGWTPVEFRQMAILSGCDYLPSLVGMGLKNAHRFLRRYKTVEKVLQAVRLEGKMKVPPTYAREFRKAELTFVHQRVYDPDSESLVTLTPLPEGTQDDLLPFIGAAIPDSIAKGIAEGIIDPISRQPIVDRNPKPLAMRSSSAQNVASGSSISRSEMLGMHRNNTVPNGTQYNGFYKHGVSSSQQNKKKVVSKEAGLQSLKNFFGTKSKKEDPQHHQQRSESRPTRQPLAERDLNRSQQGANGSPELKKGKAGQIDEQDLVLADQVTQSKFFSRPRTDPSHQSQVKETDHAYLHLGGQMTPPKKTIDPQDSGFWDNCQDLQDFLRSSPAAKSQLVSQTQSVLATQDYLDDERRTPVLSNGDFPSTASPDTVASITASVEESDSVPSMKGASILVQQTPSRGGKRKYSAASGPSSPDSGFISSPGSSIRGEGNLLSQQDSALAARRMRELQDQGLQADDDDDTMPSSPLLPCRAAGEACINNLTPDTTKYSEKTAITRERAVLGTDPIEADTEESQEAFTAAASMNMESAQRASRPKLIERSSSSTARKASLILNQVTSSDNEEGPVTPMPASRRPITVQKSASMTKLEAFRYAGAGSSRSSDNTAASLTDEGKHPTEATTSERKRMLELGPHTSSQIDVDGDEGVQDEEITSPAMERKKRARTVAAADPTRRSTSSIQKVNTNGISSGTGLAAGFLDSFRYDGDEC